MYHSIECHLKVWNLMNARMSIPHQNPVAEVATKSVLRSRRLRDRFSSEDLRVMIDLYRSGATAKQAAEKFGVSVRSVQRLRHQRRVRRNTFKLNDGYQ